MAEQTSVDSTEGATRVKDEAKPRRNPAPLIILIVLAGAGYLLWQIGRAHV